MSSLAGTMQGTNVLQSVTRGRGHNMAQRKSALSPKRPLERFTHHTNVQIGCADPIPGGGGAQSGLIKPTSGALPVIEWCGVRVVTTDTLAKGYGVPENTIHKNLSNHRDRFLEDVHIFTLKGVSLKAFKKPLSCSMAAVLPLVAIQSGEPWKAGGIMLLAW